MVGDEARGSGKQDLDGIDFSIIRGLYHGLKVQSTSNRKV